MSCYGICRMLDGSFTIQKLKPAKDRTTYLVDTKTIKRMDKNELLVGSGNYAMMDVMVYQEFFDGDELKGENRRLLVPVVTYYSSDKKSIYVVPITVSDVKLPRLNYCLGEPGGGYINPTFLFELPKKEKGGAE